MQTFPKWFYHPEKPEGLIVRSLEQYTALGAGWVESPAHFPKAEAKAEKSVAEPVKAPESKAPEPVAEAPKAEVKPAHVLPSGVRRRKGSA